jgi:hypothetical protein
LIYIKKASRALARVAENRERKWPLIPKKNQAPVVVDAREGKCLFTGDTGKKIPTDKSWDFVIWCWGQLKDALKPYKTRASSSNEYKLFPGFVTDSPARKSADRMTNGADLIRLDTMKIKQRPPPDIAGFATSEAPSNAADT